MAELFHLLCVPIFGPAIFTIRLILAWLKMPDIYFSEPEMIVGNNAELAWWHVAISLKYRLLKPFPLQELSCRLVIDPNREAELCFRPLQGTQPEHRIVLHWGDTRHIPICARATTDNYLLGFSAPYVMISGNLAENWAMRQGIARVTDGNHFFTFSDLINIAGPQISSVRLQLRIGLKLIAERRYLLKIPTVEANNDSFILTEI